MVGVLFFFSVFAPLLCKGPRLRQFVRLGPLEEVAPPRPFQTERTLAEGRFSGVQKGGRQKVKGGVRGLSLQCPLTVAYVDFPQS